jgi:hypothetical protein
MASVPLPRSPLYKKWPCRSDRGDWGSVAYGQTGAGKTYTQVGMQDRLARDLLASAATKVKGGRWPDEAAGAEFSFFENQVTTDTRTRAHTRCACLWSADLSLTGTSPGHRAIAASTCKTHARHSRSARTAKARCT